MFSPKDPPYRQEYFTMQRIKALASSFVRDEDGATMIEYALLAVLIAMVVAIAAITLGQAISNQFNKVSTCVNTPSTANCSPA
jgi:pilus assembly protein Flp/PilA